MLGCSRRPASPSKLPAYISSALSTAPSYAVDRKLQGTRQTQFLPSQNQLLDVALVDNRFTCKLESPSPRPTAYAVTVPSLPQPVKSPLVSWQLVKPLPRTVHECNLTDSRFLAEYQNDLSKPGAQQTGKNINRSLPGAKTSTSTGEYECECRYTRQETCMTGRFWA